MRKLRKTFTRLAILIVLVVSNVSDEAVMAQTLLQQWEHKESVPGDPKGGNLRVATGTNGEVLVMDKAAYQIKAWTAEGMYVKHDLNAFFDKNLMDSVKISAGTAISSDDAGNLIVNYDFPNAGSCRKFIIIPADGSGYKLLDLTLPEGLSEGRFDVLGRVVGDMLSENGAYMWVSPNQQSNVALIKIRNGIQDESYSVAIPVPLTLTTAYHCQPAYSDVSEIDTFFKFEDGIYDVGLFSSFYIRDRAMAGGEENSIWRLDGNGETVAYPSPNAGQSYGFDVFTLYDNTYIVYPAKNDSTSEDYSRSLSFAIVDTASGEVVCEHSDTTAHSVYSSFTVRKTAENVVEIYRWAAGNAVGLYTFSVPEKLPSYPESLFIRDAVVGLGKDMTEVKENIYEIEYEITDDGAELGWFYFSDADNNYLYGAGTYGEEAVANTAIGITNGSKDPWAVAQGKYIFTVDLSEETLWLTPVEDSVSVSGNCVYLNNTLYWSAPCVYAWSSDGSLVSSSWPGDAMTLQDDGLWRWDVPSDILPSYIIFSNNGSSQTYDLSYVNGATYNCKGDVNDAATTAADIYLRGEINSWGTDDAWKFINEGGGEWAIYDKTLSGYFKIASSDWSTYNFGSGDEVSAGVVYNLYDGGGDLYIAEEINCSKISFKISDGVASLYIEAKQVDDATRPVVQEAKTILLSDESQWCYYGYQTFEITGTYVSPDGLSGKVYYSVDDGEWESLTDTITSGTNFTDTINVYFYNNGLSSHSIKLRAKDANDLASLPNEVAAFADINTISVSGLVDVEYNGKEVTLPEIVVSDKTTGEVLTENTDYRIAYTPRTDAGYFSVEINGIYPNYLGGYYTGFNVTPTLLDGVIEFVNPDTTYTYNQYGNQPEVRVIDKNYGELVKYQDYGVYYVDNCYPGAGKVCVYGTGNFKTDTLLTAEFEISKREIRLSDISVSVPDPEIIYDGEYHRVTVDYAPEGVGLYSVYYTDQDGVGGTQERKDPGEYTAMISFADGEYFNGASIPDVAKFTIYEANEDDWNALVALHDSTNGNGWYNAWNIAGGIEQMGKFAGVTFTKGRITSIDLSYNNLSGSFPAGILSLPMLESLYLSNNSLTGALPVAASPSLKTIDISCNALTGNAGTFIKGIPNLTAMYASNNKISDIFPYPASSVYVDLRYQTIDKVYDFDLTKGYTSLFMTLPTVCTYAPNGGYVGFTLATDDGYYPEWQVGAYASNGTPYLYMMTGDNAYKKESGEELYYVSTSDASYGTKMKARFSFAPGDANFTGDIDVLDLQSTISYIFGRYDSTLPYNFTASNLFEDSYINVQDVVCEVNLLLANNEVETPSISSYSRETETVEASLYWEDGELILNTSVPVAAIDMIIDNAADVKWDVERFGLVASVKSGAGMTHAVIYSLTGATIPAGETVLAVASSAKAKVVKAEMADLSAQPIGVAVNKEISGIDDILRNAVELRVVDGKLVLTAGAPLENVAYSVCGIDGIVWISGAIDMLAQGEEFEIAGADELPGKFAIISIMADDEVNIIEKITIKQ